MQQQHEIGSNKINILLVDDNESNLAALETVLERSDRNLVRAASGDEALQYLLHHDVAVILLDVRMPGIDGLDTAELIRGRRQLRDVPIIFLTAYDVVDGAETSRGYSLGAVDYLIKPLDPDALKAKVSVFVDLHRKTEQIREQAAQLHEKNIQLENANFRRLGKLVELGQQLTAQREPDELLHRFCDSARDILGARYAAVNIARSENGTSLHFVESHAEMAVNSVYRLFSPAASGSQIAQVSGGALRPDFRQLPPRNLTLNPILTVPIPLTEGVNGWLYLADKADGAVFSEADQRLALTLTSQVAVAYRNAELFAEAQRQSAELLLEIAEREQAQQEKEKLLISEKAARLEAETAQKLSAELLIREREARSEAEAANRLKDEFLATVSHELRTPLNAMLGWAVLLREKKLDQISVSRAVETIERNARTLSRLVGDILDASRIITGKLAIDTGPVELVSVILSAVDVLRPAADSKKVTVSLDLPQGKGPVVLGDADRLHQIVWNLVSNAIKFNRESGAIKIQLESRNGSAHLTVDDNGIGIAPEFLPYVFDRFRQADSSMTREQTGLGLGLSIVRHLVETHGGTIVAFSEGIGQGATFTVKIPLVTGDVSLAPGQFRCFAAKSQADKEGPEYSAIDLSGFEVLVVDDEEDSRNLVKAMIENYGASVVLASSAVEALDLLSEKSSDLILSDIGMGRIDGFELIRRIRALPADKGGTIPAAALTAFASAEDEQKALEAGYLAHLPKPIDEPALISTITRLLNRKQN